MYCLPAVLCVFKAEHNFVMGKLDYRTSIVIIDVCEQKHNHLWMWVFGAGSS